MLARLGDVILVPAVEERRPGVPRSKEFSCIAVWTRLMRNPRVRAEHLRSSDVAGTHDL
jgi:hypothetical protein